jgi:hypothetical protein
MVSFITPINRYNDRPLPLTRLSLPRNIINTTSCKGLRLDLVICCVNCCSVCSLSFQICLFTDTALSIEKTVEDDLKVVKDKALGVWNDIKKVQGACSCINYNCGCCAHLEEREIELNSTSKIVMVTELVFCCTKIFYVMYDVISLSQIHYAFHISVCCVCSGKSEVQSCCYRDMYSRTGL